MSPKHSFVFKKLLRCNRAEARKGGLDTAHFSYKHARAGITKHPEGDEEVQAGLTPFTQILDFHIPDPSRPWIGDDWEDEQIDAMRNLQILNVSAEPNQVHLSDADKPYLQIRGAGNGGSNYSWFLDDSYTDDLRDLLNQSNCDEQAADCCQHGSDVNDDYIRASGSSSYKDVDDGCCLDLVSVTGGLRQAV